MIDFMNSGLRYGLTILPHVVCNLNRTRYVCAGVTVLLLIFSADEKGIRFDAGAVPATVVHCLLLTSHATARIGWEGVSNVESQETCR